MDVCVLVGKNVRRHRAEAGLSQEELAARVGLDRTYVSGVERGIRNPTVRVLLKLAEAFKIDPAELLAKPPSEHDKAGQQNRDLRKRRPVRSSRSARAPR